MEEEASGTRTFTLSEARSLLPRLRTLLSRVTSERDRLSGMREEIDRARERAGHGGGSLLGPSYLRHLIGFSEAVQQVEMMGVHVKDFQSGLIDFPHERDGRVVYLCWKPDEDEIGWWHEVDSGFAGRQPLTDDFE